MKNRFINDLRNHLNFIQTSCKSFDVGFVEESKRLAVSIRLLFHDTRNSTSLLNHLGKTNINLLSSCGESRNNELLKASFLESLVVLDGGIGLRPLFGDGPEWNYKLIPFVEWWNQIIIITPESDVFSRKSLILNIADTDGGAHVDKKLNAEYERLKEGYLINIYDNDAKPIVKKLTNHHYLHVRQIAWEIVNSEELISIIN